MIVVINKEEAEQYTLGRRIIRALSQRHTDRVNLDSILTFDKETKDIVIKESDLMKLIQMATPCQPTRHIRLI